MLYVPVRWAVHEVVALTTYRPMPAVIVDTRITTRNARSGTLFEPKVTYRFAAAGRVYEGSRLNLGPYASRYQDRAQEALRAYHPGDSVVVYVDPSDPSRSFIQRTMFWLPFWGSGLILAVLAYLYRQAKHVVDRRRARAA
jgi:Protein of unknown function (DUF3592)